MNTILQGMEVMVNEERAQWIGREFTPKGYKVPKVGVKYMIHTVAMSDGEPIMYAYQVRDCTDNFHCHVKYIGGLLELCYP